VQDDDTDTNNSVIDDESQVTFTINEMMGDDNGRMHDMKSTAAVCRYTSRGASLTAIFLP